MDNFKKLIANYNQLLPPQDIYSQNISREAMTHKSTIQMEWHLPQKVPQPTTMINPQCWPYTRITQRNNSCINYREISVKSSTHPRINHREWYQRQRELRVILRDRSWRRGPRRCWGEGIQARRIYLIIFWENRKINHLCMWIELKNPLNLILMIQIHHCLNLFHPLGILEISQKNMNFHHQVRKCQKLDNHKTDPS